MSAAPAARWRLTGKILVTLGFLVLLLYRVDWVLLVRSAAELRLGPFALAGLAFCAIGALEVGRLRTVLITFGLSWVEVLRLHIVGLFYGSFLPGQLGADLFRVIALRTPGGSVTRPLTLIVFLRLLGLAVLGVAALASIALGSKSLLDSVHWNQGLLLRALGIGAVSAAALLSHPRVRFRLSRFMRNRRNRFRQALSSLGAPQLIAVVLLSCLIVIARVLVLSSLVRAVGHSIAPIDALLIVTLAALSTTLPISFAGLGVREGVVAFLLVEASLPYEQALLVALLGRVFILLISAIGGVWTLGAGGRPKQDRAVPERRVKVSER